MKNLVFTLTFGLLATLSVVFATVISNNELDKYQYNLSLHNDRINNSNYSEDKELYRFQSICYETVKLYHRDKKMPNYNIYKDAEEKIFQITPPINNSINYFEVAYILMPFELQRAFAFCLLQKDYINILFYEFVNPKENREFVSYLFNDNVNSDYIKAKFPDKDYDKIKSYLFRMLLHLEKPCPICSE